MCDSERPPCSRLSQQSSKPMKQVAAHTFCELFFVIVIRSPPAPPVLRPPHPQIDKLLLSASSRGEEDLLNLDVCWAVSLCFPRKKTKKKQSVDKIWGSWVWGSKIRGQQLEFSGPATGVIWALRARSGNKSPKRRSQGSWP